MEGPTEQVGGAGESLMASVLLGLSAAPNPCTVGRGNVTGKVSEPKRPAAVVSRVSKGQPLPHFQPRAPMMYPSGYLGGPMVSVTQPGQYPTFSRAALLYPPQAGYGVGASAYSQVPTHPLPLSIPFNPTSSPVNPNFPKSKKKKKGEDPAEAAAVPAKAAALKLKKFGFDLKELDDKKAKLVPQPENKQKPRRNPLPGRKTDTPAVPVQAAPPPVAPLTPVIPAPVSNTLVPPPNRFRVPTTLAAPNTGLPAAMPKFTMPMSTMPNFRSLLYGVPGMTPCSIPGITNTLIQKSTPPVPPGLLPTSDGPLHPIVGYTPSPVFPHQLQKMIEAEGDELICWEDGGRHFSTAEPKIFEKGKILCKYFRHNNFGSFQRQLNIYGFVSIHTKTTRPQNRHCFTNKDFMRGMTKFGHLKRITTKNKKSGALKKERSAIKKSLKAQRKRGGLGGNNMGATALVTPLATPVASSTVAPPEAGAAPQASHLEASTAATTAVGISRSPQFAQTPTQTQIVLSNQALAYVNNSKAPYRTRAAKPKAASKAKTTRRTQSNLPADHLRCRARTARNTRCAFEARDMLGCFCILHAGEIAVGKQIRIHYSCLNLPIGKAANTGSNKNKKK